MIQDCLFTFPLPNRYIREIKRPWRCESGRFLPLAMLLAALTLALFWPARGYQFIVLDDALYVTANSHVISGLHWENVRWALTTVHEGWWLPAGCPTCWTLAGLASPGGMSLDQPPLAYGQYPAAVLGSCAGAPAGSGKAPLETNGNNHSGDNTS